MQVYARHQNKKVSLCTKESIKGKKEGVTLRHSFLYGVEVFKIETLPMYPSGAARQILTWFFTCFINIQRRSFLPVPGCAYQQIKTGHGLYLDKHIRRMYNYTNILIK